jgi:hypothetical protein
MMGFTTPPAPPPKSFKLLPEDIVTAKRRLDFSIKDVSLLLHPPSPPLTEDISFSDTPPAEISRMYNEHVIHPLSTFLSQYVSRFFFSPHWSGATYIATNGQNVALWEVVVLVDAASLVVAEAAVATFMRDKEVTIPIRVAEGAYEWGSSINRFHEKTPSPGASIGICGVLNNTVSLGGYVKGNSTGTIYAMTVGHLCFQEPQPPNSPPPDVNSVKMLEQPSGQDWYDHQKELSEQLAWLNAQGETEAAAETADKIAQWAKFQYLRLFAEPVLAVWTTTTNNEQELARVVDISLSKVNPSRCGRNITSPAGTFVANVRGEGMAQPGTRVYKIGRSSGYTEGVISALDCCFYDLRQKISFRCQTVTASRNEFMCEGGDSGSWLIDPAGRVVGMIHGAAVEVDPTVPKPMRKAAFTPIRDCLEFAAANMSESCSIIAIH